MSPTVVDSMPSSTGPNKRSNIDVCRVAKSEEKKYVAQHFTNYLVTRQKITPPGILPLETLKNLYASYQVEYPNHVPSSEIVAALNNAHFLKKKKFTDRVRDVHVEFKDLIFSNQQQNSAEYIEKDILLPRLRILTNQNYKFKNTLQKDPEVKGLSCLLCDKEFDSEEALKKHEEDRSHLLRKVYRDLRQRKSFLSRFQHLETDVKPEYVVEFGKEKAIGVKVTNISETKVMVSYVENLYDFPEIQMFRTAVPKVLESGQIFEIMFKVTFNSYSVKPYPVVLGVSSSGMTTAVNLLLDLKFTTIAAEYDFLKARSPFQRVTKNTQPFADLPVISAETNKKQQSISQTHCRLLTYDIPISVAKILNHGFKEFPNMAEADRRKFDEMTALFCDESKTTVIHNDKVLSPLNYIPRFHHMLWIEEHQMEKDIHAYDLQDVELLTKKKHLLGIQVPGLEEKRPSLIVGDRVFIRRKEGKKAKYEGIVEIVEASFVYVSVNKDLQQKYVEKEKVDVEFSFSRTPLRFCHRALEQMEKRGLLQYVFPQISYTNVTELQTSKFVYQRDTIDKNDEQKVAVQNIVRNTAYPAPYIIFGPPGTGKTATVVEAIKQITKHLPDKKICVCAPSNAAADLVAIRLITIAGLAPSDILRIYSLSRVDSVIPPELEKSCNRNGREIYVPLEEEIKKKRIIVLTPISAGRLVSAGFTGGFFDYLFIDEAGHSIEVELLVPIIGLLSRDKDSNSTGSLVLAGDPKQLGPIVRSTLAVNLGYDISLLERLMKLKLYQKDPVTGRYNSNVITKLINNYRSHEVILHVPNDQFYDNALLAKADPAKTSLACRWEGLKKTNFPLIFDAIEGMEDRESTSPSYFNIAEIGCVMKYVEDLMSTKLSGRKVSQADIGIIAPYRKQVQKIREALRRKNYKDIFVASVEEFQGQEKNIVIISTVRSRQEFLATDYQYGLGFLRIPKRFNVAVTRAAALLIVIGNPNILQCDPHWRALMDYCHTNESFIGNLPSKKVPDDFDVNKKLTMILPAANANQLNAVVSDLAVQALTLDISALTVIADEIPKDEKPEFRKYD